MAVISKAKVSVQLTIDGKVYTLSEGDIVKDLVYSASGTQNTISGAVRVLNVSTKANNAIPDDCPPEPYSHRYISVYAIVIDSSETYDAELTRINVSNIISIGSVVADGGKITVGPGEQYRPLADVIAEAEPGATVKLTEGVFEAPLELKKDIKIEGTTGTVLSGAIKLSGNADHPISVKMSGVKLTGDALVSINNTKEFSMTGCTFEGHNLTAKTMPISVATDAPIKMVIEGNTFGEENEHSYNLIDVYGKLADGSSISNNVFADASCAHNHISLYNVEEGATININNNKCAMSANMVRIGFKGEPNCTVIMDGNSYDATDANADYAGLFLVQPYGTQTTSFAKTTIKVSNTKKSTPDGQLYYLYAGSGDTQFTENNKPTVYVDGVLDENPTIR